MSQQLRQIVLFFFLALLSYAVWKFFFDREQVIQDKPFTKGYSVDNLELQITDENGDFAARFVSPSLVRYTDSTVVHIQKPEFWTYSQGNENWMFISNKAEYDYKDNWVNLLENVEANSLNSDEKIRFQAHDLLVQLDKKTAETLNGIEIQKETLNMTGQKAQFDFTNNKIEVNENVKVVYKASN